MLRYVLFLRDLHTFDLLDLRTQEPSLTFTIFSILIPAQLYLLHFTRLPAAKLTSIDIAINKAFTAAGHRAPTSAYKQQVTPGGAAYGLAAAGANHGRFTYVAGGVPVVVDGEVVGAVGCSTGTPAQDEEVATAGVEAVYASLKQKAKL